MAAHAVTSKPGMARCPSCGCALLTRNLRRHSRKCANASKFPRCPWCTLSVQVERARDHVYRECGSSPASSPPRSAPVKPASPMVVFWQRNGIHRPPFPRTQTEYERSRKRIQRAAEERREAERARDLASVIREESSRRPYRSRHNSLGHVPPSNKPSDDALDQAFIRGLGTRKR